MQPLFFVNSSVMVFYRSGEVQPGIEEDCNSEVVFCEELDDCWRTENSWYGFMTELFNGGSTYITGDDNLFIFELLSLWLNHRLSQGFITCLPWLFLVPLLWRLPITFGSVMINVIWVCGGVVCLLLFLLMTIKRREPTFWHYNCSHVWVSVPGVKLITIYFSQYNLN